VEEFDQVVERVRSGGQQRRAGATTPVSHAKKKERERFLVLGRKALREDGSSAARVRVGCERDESMNLT
jgi:hypothetical protein